MLAKGSLVDGCVDVRGLCCAPEPWVSVGRIAYYRVINAQKSLSIGAWASRNGVAAHCDSRGAGLIM